MDGARFANAAYQLSATFAELTTELGIDILSMGGTKTLPELYKIAGLEFDFSPEKIKVLMDFVEKEMRETV